MQPPRALWEIRQALGREDILISDVGLHKLWIGRMFPAHEPNTVLIANGLAGMGFALPCAIAAKLVHPERHVVTVSGDGGFLMNCQELETAVRLGTPIVNVIWENQPVRLDRLEAGQEVRPPLRRSTSPTPTSSSSPRPSGCRAWRCESVERLRAAPAHALALDVPSLIVLPIDYSIDVAISEELGDGDSGSDMSTATVNAQEQSILDRVPKQLYIGGEWRDATGGGTLAVEDPATGETIAEVADATVEDAVAALDAAADAQAELAATPPRERGEILRRAYEPRSSSAPTTSRC